MESLRIFENTLFFFRLGATVVQFSFGRRVPLHFHNIFQPEKKCFTSSKLLSRHGDFYQKKKNEFSFLMFQVGEKRFSGLMRIPSGYFSAR